MSTITTEQQQAIAALVASMTLPRGLGTKESACSIAAINLALSGELTDQIPACMSIVIGKWIIGVQDAMPAEMRNSTEWKRLLPGAAGTGRQHEKERLEIIMDWMWRTVLPTVQPIAGKNGFGEEWRIMLSEKTPAAAKAATNAAAKAAINAAAAAVATKAAINAAAVATSYASNATYASNAATYAATYAANAAFATTYTAAATSSEVWHQFNPCGLLERLIAVSQTAHES